MSNATRRLIRSQQQRAPGLATPLPSPQELQQKILQILQVGEQLAAVSGQIGEVNGQLKNLDQVVAEVKAARGLLEEVVQEQSRQRYVSLAMFKHSAVSDTFGDDFDALEKKFRAEFNRNHNLREEP